MIPARHRDHGGHGHRNRDGRRQLVLDNQDLDLDGERYDPDDEDQVEEADGDLIDALGAAFDRLRSALQWWPGVAALGFLVGWGWAVRYPTPLVGPLVGLAATVGLCWSAARTEWTWRGYEPGRLRPSWAYRLALPVTAAAGLVLAYWPAALQQLSALEEVRRCR